MFTHQRSREDRAVTIKGVSYNKNVILADVNIPYKLSLDRGRNKLFFCINADEFSDQSFHSVILDLDTRLTSVVPSIRNGFASAVDQTSGAVYLGGSDGIFKFNYDTQDIEKPALVKGIDIFDMYFNRYLYFIDTANQNLYVYKASCNKIIPEVEGYMIHHFVVNNYRDLIFVSPMGVFSLPKGARSPVMYQNGEFNFRGATTDVNGVPYFIARDGIYTIDEESKQLVRILRIENGYGLAFDKDNNIVYSDERTVTKLIPCESL